MDFYLYKISENLLIKNLVSLSIICITYCVYIVCVYISLPSIFLINFFFIFYTLDRMWLYSWAVVCSTNFRISKKWFNSKEIGSIAYLGQCKFSLYKPSIQHTHTAHLATCSNRTNFRYYGICVGFNTTATANTTTTSTSHMECTHIRCQRAYRTIL